MTAAITRCVERGYHVSTGTATNTQSALWSEYCVDCGSILTNNTKQVPTGK